MDRGGRGCKGRERCSGQLLCRDPPGSQDSQLVGRGGEGRTLLRTFQACLPHKVGLCLGLLAPSPGKQQRRGREGKGAARREARARGAQALRTPAWRGSTETPGAPGAGWSQPSQSGTRSPKLSHRGERLGRRSETGLRSLNGRLQPQLRRWPPAAARAGKGCCARAPAGQAERSWACGCERRSSGSARGGGWNRLTKRGRAPRCGSPGRATA